MNRKKLKRELTALRDRVYTEWYNGNMTEDARIRILADPEDFSCQHEFTMLSNPPTCAKCGAKAI